MPQSIRPNQAVAPTLAGGAILSAAETASNWRSSVIFIFLFMDQRGLRLCLGLNLTAFHFVRVLPVTVPH
jgi:hypothetical protein